MPTSGELDPQSTSVAIPEGQPDVVARAFAALADARARIVPVVGAGLAAAAGAPSAAALAGALQEAAGQRINAAGLFNVADTLEERHGTAWVQRIVADTVSRNQIAATRTLRSLVRLPSRIVATTNYDDAIVAAVDAVGLHPRVFYGPTLNEGLRTPSDDDVHILHLHGHHADLASLVLTHGSYDEALRDPALEYALHRLTAEQVLVFLGQSLDARERHVRRDLLWASRTFRQTGPHYLFLPEKELPRPDLQGSLETDMSMVVAPYHNDDGTFEVVDLAAQHIGLGVPPAGPTLPTDVDARRTATYLPVPIVPAEELADPSQRAAWEMLGTAFNRHVDIDTVLAHPRAILFGAPGSGKTQALLHAGHITQDRHVIYRSLGDTPTPHPSASAIDIFLQWVRRGSAFHDETPRPSRHTLAGHVFLFLLDGLDEVRREDRSRVLDIITQVAARYPHQLFLIASRPYHGSDDDAPTDFNAFELVPDRTWFHAYLEHVGVTDQQLERTLPTDAPLQDLVRLPIFAEAVAEAARSRRPLPRSPLQAIRIVASAGLERETQILADPDHVDRWLDALAVIAEARHGTGLPLDVALNPDVAAPFNVAPSEDLLDDLIERALVVSNQGTVSFPANVVQEARAAHGLWHSTRGLQLLHQHALVELDDGTRGVHPTWRHTVELLCYEAPSSWRAAVARYDPRLAARSTPIDAGLNARQDALTTLLNWYDERKVWWLRRDDHGQLRDDLDAVVALIGGNDLHRQAVEWAQRHLNSPERALRGNAMMLLARLGETELVQSALPSALEDPDTVVRRIAAESHHRLELTGYHEQLRNALDAEPDELEERQLLAEYIRTAPRREVLEMLAHRWPSEMSSWRAGRALDSRFTRQDQLEVLNETEEHASGWLSHLLSQSDSTWTAVEVERLAELLYGDPHRVRRYSFEARPILRQHLFAALPVVWANDQHDAKYLVYQAPSDTLTELRELELPPDLIEMIEDVLERRRSAPPAEPNTNVEHHVSPSGHATLAEAAEVGWDAVAAVPLDLMGNDLRELTDEARLRQVVEAAWDEAHKRPEGPAGDLRRVDDNRVRARRDTFPLLRLAAHFQLPLDEPTWFHLMQVGWPEPGLDTWMRERFDPAWFPSIEDRITTLSEPAVRQLIDVLPLEQSPVGLVSAIAVRLQRSGELHAYRRYVSDLAAAGRSDAVRHIHAMDPTETTVHAMVRVGDCGAERQLFEAELQAELPRRPSHYGNDHWLSHVSCVESVPFIVERILEAESKDADHAYTTVLHSALHRAAGLEGLQVYDDLMRARPYPDAPFLWFRQADLRDQLLANAIDGDLSGAEVQSLVEALVSTTPAVT